MNRRRVAWFSCGAPSAVAAKLSAPDVVAYCETGSEHPDNERFADDVAAWLGMPITRLRSEKYKDTWSVWEDRKYISGIDGAPCTGALKIVPRQVFERPDDIHIFGYTTDWRDMQRAEALKENWPELSVEFPLIKRGLNKAACIAMIGREGLRPPITYELGFESANCIPCCKATSPAYWALVRKHFPVEFNRFAEISKRLGVRAARVNGERVFVDEIPKDQPTTEPIQPDCDFLCAIAEEEFGT